MTGARPRLRPRAHRSVRVATPRRRASASSAEPATCGASRCPSSMHTSMVCAQSSRGAPTRPAKNAAALMIRWSGSRSVRSMCIESRWRRLRVAAAVSPSAVSSTARIVVAPIWRARFSNSPSGSTIASVV
ncbi:hypothetical protein L479_02522 [Exiguobacterium sp. S17]|nr:hypothetical protein L479_02522 [Exiguobacterium sp. S17]